MKCNRCSKKIRDEDSYTYLGETLCDDCYMDARFSAKACDPWAVYTATRTRETSGLSGAESLTELQKGIYEFVKSKGKTLVGEVMENFNISRDELESQFVILRHCELVKGRKEGDKFYLVPFA